MIGKERLTAEEIEEFEKLIDPTILPLIIIIKMNQLPFLKTTWSCGGHIGITDCGSYLDCHLYHRGIKFAISSLHPGYDLQADWFKFPELKDKTKRKEIEQELERVYEETYGRLNNYLESYVISFPGLKAQGFLL